MLTRLAFKLSKVQRFKNQKAFYYIGSPRPGFEISKAQRFQNSKTLILHSVCAPRLWNFKIAKNSNIQKDFFYIRPADTAFELSNVCNFKTSKVQKKFYITFGRRVQPLKFQKFKDSEIQKHLYYIMLADPSFEISKVQRFAFSKILILHCAGGPSLWDFERVQFQKFQNSTKQKTLYYIRPARPASEIQKFKDPKIQKALYYMRLADPALEYLKVHQFKKSWGRRDPPLQFQKSKQSKIHQTLRPAFGIATIQRFENSESNMLHPRWARSV